MPKHILNTDDIPSSYGGKEFLIDSTAGTREEYPKTPKPTPLKCGDRVTWKDGSYAVSVNFMGFSHYAAPAMTGRKKRGRITAVDCVLPTTESSGEHNVPPNDTIVHCDCGSVIFTKIEFLERVLC